MIYLDTNITIWLAENDLHLISDHALKIIDETDALFVSHFVRLELQYLYEIKRLKKNPDTIIKHLNRLIGLNLCDLSLNKIIEHALTLSWTRDPFDRLITANASIEQAVLLTKDATILKHYPHAIW